MISKLTTEEDLKKMFLSYGLIENITVLRYQDGQSKGCAFLKYRNKSMAQKAIKNVHHSQTMPGCSQPIVVKIADTERDKAVKKMQHQFNQALHVYKIFDKCNSSHHINRHQNGRDMTRCTERR